MSSKDNLFRLLMIDDDDLMHASLKLGLPDNWKADYHNFYPTNLELHPYHVALVDMHLSGDIKVAEGVNVIAGLRRKHPHLEIIAMSGNLDRQIMEACLKAGATRFLAKPINKEELEIVLGKIENLVLLRRVSQRSKAPTTPWIGTSPASVKILRQIAEMTGEPGPILIEGETGTGKEVVTQLIHSFDSHRPLITVNVAAISANLFESEFFGHNKGSFTGAEQNKMGLAEAAHGGDLFLDELEALPMAMQPKLLRFLESGEIRRVGASEATSVHVRTIAATNVNLEQMVKGGLFREDLLWRLKGRYIKLPPLRQRKEDIPLLAKYFIANLKPARQKVFAEDAFKAMDNYDWPGNVRELKRVCEQLTLIAPLPIIREEDVERVITSSASPDDTGLKVSTYDLSQGLSTLISRVEAKIIQQALSDETDIEEASKLLQISRSCLYKKIKDYHITLK